MNLRLCAAVLSCVTLLAFGTIAKADAPATERSVAASQPSAAVSPEARVLLDQVKSAYGSLKSLDITATVDANFDIDGEKKNQHADLKATFQAGGRFRSEIKDDAMVGNTGEKLFLFLPERNQYAMFDEPTNKVDLFTISSQIGDMLPLQNISLAMALAPDAAAVLTDGAATVSREPDVTINNTPLPALLISRDSMDIEILLDPQTHLVRRQNLDVARMARLRGAQDVKLARVAIDFKSVADGPVTDSQFAWAPPAGAQEMHAPPAALEALKGKPAPAFTLPGLDGKNVSNADLKGSVYILDFWATWCAPCIAALPELDQYYQAHKAAGLKVFAVNLGDDKDTVQKFVTDHKLTIPVLLDTDTKVAEAYSAEKIPETVVVGKDGNVVDAFIGIGKEDDIRKAAEGAMKAN